MMLELTNLGERWKCGELVHAWAKGWQQSRALVSVLRLCAFEHFPSLNLSLLICIMSKLLLRFPPVTSVYESKYKH